MVVFQLAPAGVEYLEMMKLKIQAIARIRNYDENKTVTLTGTLSNKKKYSSTVKNVQGINGNWGPQITDEEIIETDASKFDDMRGPVGLD